MSESWEVRTGGTGWTVIGREGGYRVGEGGGRKKCKENIEEQQQWKREQEEREGQ